jgi:hypothetical protein
MNSMEESQSPENELADEILEGADAIAEFLRVVPAGRSIISPNVPSSRSSGWVPSCVHGSPYCSTLLWGRKSACDRQSAGIEVGADFPFARRCKLYRVVDMGHRLQWGAL